MSLDDKIIHAKVIVEDPSIILRDIKEIPKILFKIPTFADELQNEIPSIPVNVESLLQKDFTVVFEEYLVPAGSVPTIYSGIKTSLIVDIDVAGDIDTTHPYSNFSFDLINDIVTQGYRTTHDSVAASFAIGSTVQGYRTTKSSIVLPFTMGIVTAGIAIPATGPEFKAVGTIASVGGDNSLSPALPSGWAAGDFAICFGWVDLRSGNSLGTGNPAGWTSLINIENGTIRGGLRVWYRRLQSGDSGPIVYLAGSGSWLTTDSLSAIIITFSEVDTTTPFAHSSIQSGLGNGSPISVSSITTVADNALAVTLMGRGDDEAFSAETYGGSSTGVSELFDVAGTGGDDSELAAFAKLITAAGSVGAAAATTSATDPWVACTFALRKAT